MNHTSYLEKLTDRLLSQLSEKKLVILSALVSGLMAYLFCFVNKLETMDDLAGMYGQAATLSSGRWGLDLLTYFTPNFSLPWLNGILSLLLIILALCFVTDLFEIRSKVLQIVLPSVMIVFPSQVCTYGYMFTTVQYAVALLSAVCGAYVLARKKTWGGMILSAVLFIFTMSIYQPFIAAAASYLVVYVIFLVLKNEKTSRDILRTGISFICVLAASMIVYYGITAVLQRIQGVEMNEYGKNSLSGISELMFGLRVAYTSFFGYFLKGYYDLVPTVFSRILHAGIAAVILFLLVLHLLSAEDKGENRKKLLIVLVCLLILPPAVNCIRIITTMTHNLMLFSVTSVYVLAAAVIQHASVPKEKFAGILKDFASLGMALIVGINILFANGVYFKMYMQEKQAESFYTGVISALMQENNFKKDSPVAFVGSNDVLFPIPMVNTDNLVGIREGIVGTYSQEEFLRTFLGVRLNICDDDITNSLKADERVVSMPSYPYYGCVQELDGVFVVKLG